MVNSYQELKNQKNYFQGNTSGPFLKFRQMRAVWMAYLMVNRSILRIYLMVNASLPGKITISTLKFEFNSR